MTAARRVRVVVVEDSLVQRAHIVAVLEAAGEIEVVGQATAADEAADVVERLRPDVVTLDLQIPGGGGLHAIERIMGFAPTPILVLSSTISGRDSTAAVEALVAGALDAFPKPDRWGPEEEERVRRRVVALRGAHVIRHPRGRLHRPAGVAPSGEGLAGGDRLAIVGLAASTGGPPAVASVLSGLAGLPAAVLVVQHLHPDFIGGFVDWMARESPLPVRLAAQGTRLRPGNVYIGPGDVHLKVGPSGSVVLDAQPATLHRPSADQLFASLAEHAGGTAVGVVLTGMGDDGSAGLLALRRRGGATIVQDEATSAVFGMPGAALRAGAATEALALERVPDAVRRAVRRISR